MNSFCLLSSAQVLKFISATPGNCSVLMPVKNNTKRQWSKQQREVCTLKENLTLNDGINESGY